ncbi:expressed unknown protein [Seminavis robusta]|uniref:Uncharacterized protein n=1 Tax=Seminavis robusta TaxID=568900 RepID=A0A9N8H3N4_9STRA|nr:expressed unknown protein [Seminavis robusta]|eukprot:Sro65_g036670.1 n/a (130) ;mRNA; r:44499-44888
MPDPVTHLKLWELLAATNSSLQPRMSDPTCILHLFTSSRTRQQSSSGPRQQSSPTVDSENLKDPADTHQQHAFCQALKQMEKPLLFTDLDDQNKTTASNPPRGKTHQGFVLEQDFPPYSQLRRPSFRGR